MSTSAPSAGLSASNDASFPLADAGLIPMGLPPLPPNLPRFLNPNGTLVLPDVLDDEETPNDDEDDDDLAVGPGEQHYIYLSRDIKALVFRAQQPLMQIVLLPWRQEESRLSSNRNTSWFN